MDFDKVVHDEFCPEAFSTPPSGGSPLDYFPSSPESPLDLSIPRSHSSSATFSSYSPGSDSSASDLKGRRTSSGAKNNGNVQVYVRARPFMERETKESILTIHGGEVSIHDPKADYKVKATYSFTDAFDSTEPDSPDYVDQKAIYEKMGKQIIENVFEGYNSCLLAYGQTGSGKTYTMMGAMTGSDVGITPRLCAHLFARIEAIKALRTCSFSVEAMYCEIYNEKVRDLLVPKNKMGSNLKIRQSGKQGTVVEGLSRHPIHDMEGVVKLINRGNERRSTAATDLNDQSSRSHAVFTLHFSQVRLQAKGTDQVQTKEVNSVVHFVDLAGSERVKLSGVKGQHLEEAKNINLSLSTLGRVIETLVQAAATGKKMEPPYRESALTWMLRNSFGGNSKTIMIATVSPSAISFEETHSTLRYASRAKKVVNRAVMNVREEVKMLCDLQFEIEDIQKQLRDVRPQELVEQEEQIASLTEQLRFHEQMLAELQDQTETVRRQWEISDREKGQQLEKEAMAREQLQQQYEALEKEHHQAITERQEHVRQLQMELTEKEKAIQELSDSRILESHQRITELEQLVSNLREKELAGNNTIRQLQAELEVARFEISDLQQRLVEKESTIHNLEQKNTEATQTSDSAEGRILQLLHENERLSEALHNASIKTAVAETQVETLKGHRNELEARMAELLAEGRLKDEKVNQLIKETMQMGKQLATLECEKAASELQLTDILEKLHEMEEELRMVLNNHQEMVRTHEIDQETIQKLEEENERLQQAVFQQNGPNPELQQWQEELTAAGQRQKVLEGEISTMRQQLQESEERNAQLLAQGDAEQQVMAKVVESWKDALRTSHKAQLDALMKFETKQRTSILIEAASEARRILLGHELTELRMSHQQLQNEHQRLIATAAAQERHQEKHTAGLREECNVWRKKFESLQADCDRLQTSVDSLTASQGEELSELLVSNLTLKEKVNSLKTDLSTMQKELKSKTEEMRELYRTHQQQKDVLKAQLAQQFKENEGLHAELLAKMEQVESLEAINDQMSAEYNTRLSKLITDSQEWKRMISSICTGGGDLDGEPKSPPPRSSLKSWFFPTKVATEARPLARTVSSPVRHLSDPRSPGGRMRVGQGNDSKRLRKKGDDSYGNMCAAYALSNGSSPEVEELKMHIRVLESNLETMRSGMLKVLQRHGMGYECLAYLNGTPRTVEAQIEMGLDR